MEAKNRYYSVPDGLYERILRGDSQFPSEKALFESRIPDEGPCIFLSHKTEDKPEVQKIASYILSKGIDIYLDSMDKSLQLAVSKNDDVAITKMIELGLSTSTHLLVILSDATQQSWWVPYEIGYSKAQNKEVSSCIFKTIKYANSLPSYLAITEKITATDEMDDYLAAIGHKSPLMTMAAKLLESMDRSSIHALSNILE